MEETKAAGARMTTKRTNINQGGEKTIVSKSENHTLYAKWTSAENIPYTIYHYVENANDNGYTLYKTEEISGVGKVKAIQMKCLAEISRRMARASFKPFLSFQSPQSIADYFMENTRYLEKEYVYLLMFDAKHKLIKDVRISEGTVNSSMLSPREVFVEALRYDAVYIILVHNHPSGDPTPSGQDIDITREMDRAGELIGIE